MAEAKFVIQGVDYPVPGFDTFSMDEAQILYELTGLTLEDFDENSQVEIKLSPGLLRTMMLVALMRQNPRMSRAAADKIAGQVKQLDAIEHLYEGDDADPPTSPETSGSGSNSGSSDSSSGPSSENGSAVPQESSRPTDTGTPPSATPPISDPATLAGSLQ